MAFLAPVAATAGSVLTNPLTWEAASFAGGILQSKGQAKQGAEQMNAYNQNAELYTQQAQSTRKAAELEYFRKKKAIKSLIGAQKAGYAARGVSVNTGSPIDVMVADIATGELDIAIDQYNADVASKRYDHAAAVERYYGQQSSSGGSTAGAGNLLQTAVQFGSLMSKLKKVG